VDCAFSCNCRYIYKELLSISQSALVNRRAHDIGAFCFNVGRMCVLTAFMSVVTSAKDVMFLSLFVCLLATLCKNFQTDLYEIFMEG